MCIDPPSIRIAPWTTDAPSADRFRPLAARCNRLPTKARRIRFPELAGLLEILACYPDFASIRRTKEHFVLTRSQNLIAGGDYCDTCFHDERYVPDFVHPPRETFEGLRGPRGLSGVSVAELTRAFRHVALQDLNLRPRVFLL